MNDDITEGLKSFLNRMTTLVVVFDAFFKCVYTNNPKLIKIGDDLNISSTICFISKTNLFPLTIKKKTYCARITPYNEKYFICELLSDNNVFDIARKTGIYDLIAQPIKELHSNIDFLWDLFSILQSKLKDCDDPDIFNILFEAEKSVADARCINKSIMEFLYYRFNEPETDLIEVNMFLNDLVNQCNTVLAKCDKYIEFVSDNKMYFVRANTRHAMFALINLLQNSILLSDSNSVPYVVVYKTVEDNRSMIVIRVINDTLNEDILPTNRRRKGLGIEAVKNFSKDVGGSFDITEEGGRVTAQIKIPEFINKSDELVFSSNDRMEENDAYQKELIDLFMKQAVDRLK